MTKKFTNYTKTSNKGLNTLNQINVMLCVSNGIDSLETLVQKVKNDKPLAELLATTNFEYLETSSTFRIKFKDYQIKGNQYLSTKIKAVVNRICNHRACMQNCGWIYTRYYNQLKDGIITQKEFDYLMSKTKYDRYIDISLGIAPIDHDPILNKYKAKTSDSQKKKRYPKI